MYIHVFIYVKSLKVKVLHIVYNMDLWEWRITERRHLMTFFSFTLYTGHGFPLYSSHVFPTSHVLPPHLHSERDRSPMDLNKAWHIKLKPDGSANFNSHFGNQNFKYEHSFYLRLLNNLGNHIQGGFLSCLWDNSHLSHTERNRCILFYGQVFLSMSLGV